MTQTEMTNQPRIYFDHNASAPLLDCARTSMIELLDCAGNASSVHFEGREARKTVELTRRNLADLIDANPANVIFTSGATEAANHVLSPKMRSGGQQLPVARLYVSATEHPCILLGGRVAPEQTTILKVLESGTIDLEALRHDLGNHDHTQGLPLVSVQHANNETGIIQPVLEVADIVHEHDGLLVVDAVQSLGKLPFGMADTGADFLIFSSHKIGGPQGAGALVLANGGISPEPLVSGGGQESFHRGGTENVAAIAGFGAACEWHANNLTKNIKNFCLRDSIESGISTISQESGNGLRQPVFFGKSENRLGNTSCFSVPGVRAETALVALDLEGISVSSGSACSSGKVKRSHVLEAMGAKPEEMEGALRVSLGWTSTEEEASRFLNVWKTIIGRLAN
ncbi:MAG: cysteine desulfurase family protein [Rhizobiaceae bacterium]